MLIYTIINSKIGHLLSEEEEPVITYVCNHLIMYVCMYAIKLVSTPETQYMYYFDSFVV